MEPKECERLW